MVWAHHYPDPEFPYLENSDIYIYNSTSGKSDKIQTALLYQDIPDIWEDNVVMTAWEDDNLEIHLFNLTTQEDRRITNDVINQVNPRIWGDWVVWQEGDEWETDHGIVLYEIITGNTTHIGNISGKSPDIWGDRVVWDEYTTGDGNFDIFLYNITSGNITTVTTDPSAQISPAIWGDLIVWMDNRDIARQIYLYDLGSGNESCLTSGDFYREPPRISGNYVVYVNDTVVSLINLETMTEFPISTDLTGSPATDPDIWEDRIVWSDMRNGDFDIYLYTVGVTLPPLIADFTTNATQGNSPFVVTFNDTTSGQAVGWHWDFGDGYSSDEQNPVHTYDSDGSYTIILTVNNPWQRDAVRKTDLISVGSVPVPAFDQNPTSGPAPLAVQFTDQSSGTPIAWYWDFGDGEFSDDQNPEHVYLLPGIYTVNLSTENAFGNASVVKQDLITVMDGTFHTCVLPSEGISLTAEGTRTRLTLDTSRAGNCTGDSPENPAGIMCVPDTGTGIASIRFMSSPPDRFTGPENGTFTGLIGDIWITSCDMSPLNFSQKAGDQCFFNFTINPDQYEAGGSIRGVIWEGCTPEDFQMFNDIKIKYNYGNIDDLVYTVRFDEENLTDTGPATLVFGVSSDWVREFGWGDNRTLDIRSVPEGARVYVDTVFLGQTPLNATDLAPGPHEVKLVMNGYKEQITTMVIADERDSIHVIRIGEDGTGAVLNTTFIGHDPERNLDFFRAESPDGLSTFGLASLSKSGNILQIINMVFARLVGGGGGGGGGGVPSTSTGPPTSEVTPEGTASPPPSTMGPGDPGSPPKTEEAPDGEITSPPPAETPQAKESAVPPTSGEQGFLGSLVEPTSSLITLKSLSVIFVVIFVTVVFYLRWKRP